jgi:dihydrofolate synthase/folylpolyglutamate synthase
VNYQESVDFLFSQLPMFQNEGKSAYKTDITNTVLLLEALGNPHLNVSTKWIHVAGTNGKGSVSSSLAAILTSNGYKTGLYTSPHLIDFRERIRINGECISETFVIDFVASVRQLMIDIKPSFFEITVAMAFEYFKQQQIDWGIIEVGLGGRLDSTNVIEGDFKVITSIGFDHMDLLGDQLEQIASEKAGIIKGPSPTVIQRNIPNQALNVILNRAKSCDSDAILSTVAPTEWYQNFELKGKYQQLNISTIFTVIEVLKSTGVSLDESQIQNGLSNIVKLSGLRGRWEIIKQDPTIICDTGHNEDGIRFIIDQLNSLKSTQDIIFIWGMVKDKDRKKILSLLPKDSTYLIVKPQVQRGHDSNLMTQEFIELGLNAKECHKMPEAIEQAISLAKNNDSIIFIGGSTFTVADALKNF